MNYKQSNYLMDVVMPALPPNAFKVVCAVARMSWGWREETVALSYSKLVELTGISSINTLKKAIAEAVTAGFLSQEDWANTSKYEVLVVSTVSEIDSTMSEIDTDYVNEGVSEIDTRVSEIDTDYVNKGGGTMSEIDTPSYYIKKRDLRERERNSLPPIVNGIPMIECEAPELPQADNLAVEEWAAGLNDLVREGYFPASGIGKHWEKAQEFRQLASWLIVTYPNLSLGEFKEKWATYWETTGLKGKPWLSQVQSLADEAIQFEPTANERVDKQQMVADVWTVVRRTGRRGYAEARSTLNGQWPYIEQMGKWATVCDMNEQTFRIKFFEAFNRMNER